ncbi:MAG: LIC_10190 family membrane protein [Thermoanaerobaculia bacterium]
MLAVLAGLLIWVPALLGWGSLVLPALLGGRLCEDDDTGLALRGFAGLGVLGTAGAALNLLVGLGPALAAGAALVGLALFAREAKVLGRTFTKADALALSGLALLVAFFASGPIRLFDTGLYHLPAVAWTTAGPIPAGLANLHRRFGLNSLWFPAAALLELPLLAGRSAWLVSPLALLFFGSAVWKGARKTVAGTADASSVLLALGVFPLAVFSANEWLPSLSTDLPAATLTILASTLLLRQPCGRLERRAAVSLAFFAVMVKLSAAVFFASVFLVARAFPLALLLPVVAWGARGIALSGYLVYPVVRTRLSFLPWAAPAALAREEVDWARSWARVPGRTLAETLTGNAWLSEWARATATKLSILLLFLLFAAGLAALLLARRRPARSSGGRFVAVFAAALASTLFWFSSAPDPRFGYGALFVLAALPLAAAIPRFTAAEIPLRLRWISAGLAAAALALSGVDFVVSGSGVRPSLVVPPEARRPLSKELRTNDGETVFVPVMDACWDVPRPCTPYLDPALVIERDGSGRPRVFWLPPPSPTGSRP